MAGGDISQTRDQPAPAAGAGAASPPGPATPRERLPLVITVGFSGHRAFDDPVQVASQMDRALALVRDALAGLQQRPLSGAGERLGEAYEGPARLRLITGDAPGGDRLLVERWQAAGLGEVHRLYPFRDPLTGDALTDRPEHASDETRREPPDDAPWTGLDPAGLGLPETQGHAEVTQWIIRHSELLIAVWDGRQMTRPGGTGDTLRKGLSRGLPVIWIQPGESGIRLANPVIAHRRGGLPDSAEALDAVCVELTAQDLAEMLEPAVAPPGAIRRHGRDPEVVGREDYAEVDPLKPWPRPFRLVQWLSDRTIWKTFKVFEEVLGGAEARRPSGGSPRAPERIASQPGFIYLRGALSEATSRAGALSSIHRSQQLLLIVLATVAVFFGALPALFQVERAASPGTPNVAVAASAAPAAVVVSAPGTPGAARSASVSAPARHARDPNAKENGWHALAAAVELGLVVSALGIAFLAGRYHRHRRWSDARRLAERLRAARATWPLGVDIADARLTPPRSWTEWRAEAVMRAAGPRQGWIDAVTFPETAAWAVADLLEGQAAYHERQYKLAARISGAIRWTERIAFFLLLAALAGFILGYWYARIEHLPLSIRVSGFVTVISAVCPALGAACLALEATSGFSELELRSERLAHEFRELRSQLDEDDGMAYHHVQDVIRRGAQLLVEESGAWRDQVARRRLVQAA